MVSKNKEFYLLNLICFYYTFMLYSLDNLIEPWLCLPSIRQTKIGSLFFWLSQSSISKINLKIQNYLYLLFTLNTLHYKSYTPLQEQEFFLEPTRNALLICFKRHFSPTFLCNQRKNSTNYCLILFSLYIHVLIEKFKKNQRTEF